MKAGIALLCTGAFLAAGFANAEDRVTLADRTTIENDCAALKRLGVTCEIVASSEMTGPEGSKGRWVHVDSMDLVWPMTVPAEQLSWSERVSNKAFYGQLLFFEQRDSAGQAFYMAHPAVLSKATVNSDPYSVLDKDNFVWNAVGGAIPTAQVDSDEARQYLSGLDDAAATKAANEARAAKEIADRRTFEQSPEYKKRQLNLAAEQCQKTIQSARAAIDHDKRVAAVSGYENKLVREQAAEMIVNCEDTIRQSHQTP